MAHRLGLFLAAIIIGLAVLIAQPWIPDAPGFAPDGQYNLIRYACYVAAVLYALIRGMGWVVTGGKR